MLPVKRLRLMIVTLLAITISGCGDDSERVAQVALEASKRQAALDQDMAHLNQEVSQTNRSVAESQGKSQQQVLTLAQDVQNQRQQLDQDRRDVATLRERESLLAPVFLTVGSLAVCSLPLVLCLYLLKGLSQDSSDVPVTQLLVDQLMLVDDPLGISDPPPSRPLVAEGKPVLGLASHQGNADAATPAGVSSGS